MATIRRATPADAEAAVALWARLQHEQEVLEPRLRRSASAEQRWRTDFRAWVRSPAHAVLVAEDTGRVVGLVTAHPYWPAPVYEERLEVYVNELVVDPAWRGRGIGRALVEAVRAWARRLGAVRVRAGVVSANARARAFWQHVGATDLYTTVTLELDRSSDAA